MTQETKRKLIISACTIAGHVIGSGLASMIVQTPAMIDQPGIIRVGGALLVDGLYTGVGYVGGKLIADEVAHEY